jgi:hypothetical protein
MASRKGQGRGTVCGCIQGFAAVFHEFVIEQRVGKEIRASTLSAQIIEIEEGPSETRVLIRPDPSLGLDDALWMR